MGRQKFNKRDHIARANMLHENRDKKGLLYEQPGFDPEPEKISTPPPTGCDLSCVDLSDTFTDSIVAQGGGPNSLQTYDPNTSYAPGSVVCHLDPGTNVTNVFIASANSGQLVPGGGPYPEPEEGVTAFPWPLPPGTPTTSYYWEPGLILATCLGTGDWWCDPTGQYLSPTGTPCLQSPTQPQSYFTGPSTTEQNCIASCGSSTEEYVCMGGVAGPAGTNTCTGPHAVGTYQMGDPNVMGIYPTQADCDVACNGIVMCDPPPNGCPVGEIWMPAPICACQTDPNAGTACDISWNTPCAQQHLLTGAQNSWTNFLNLRQTGWDSVGCQHLQNVVNWTTDQLNSGVTGNGTPLNPTQIARKTEKRLWAECQGIQCGCTINMPPLTGTGNQTEDSHENFTGTVCDCTELSPPGPGQTSCGNYSPGTGFQGGGATHQCNGQMCTQSDIGNTFEYTTTDKTLIFTLNTINNPGIFGVSQTPGINMTSSTCPTPPPSPAPTDKAKPEKMTPTKGEKEKKELKEEINRMKSLWRHK